MFTPGLLYDNLAHFAQEIERAQAKVRHDNAVAKRLANPILARRRA
jgi:hypothetical protein